MVGNTDSSWREYIFRVGEDGKIRLEFSCNRLTILSEKN